MTAGFAARQVDIDAKTGKVVFEEEINVPDTPLNKLGSLVTLLVVCGVLDIKDAASAAGLTEEDLVVEARSWAAAMEKNNAD